MFYKDTAPTALGNRSANGHIAKIRATLACDAGTLSRITANFAALQ